MLHTDAVSRIPIADSARSGRSPLPCWGGSRSPSRGSGSCTPDKEKSEGFWGHELRAQPWKHEQWLITRQVCGLFCEHVRLATLTIGSVLAGGICCGFYPWDDC